MPSFGFILGKDEGTGQMIPLSLSLLVRVGVDLAWHSSVPLDLKVIDERSVSHDTA